MATPKTARTLPPLHFIFAQAHKAGDAKKPLDMRDASGARIVSGHRGMGRHPVDEADLRAEVRDNLSGLLNSVHMEATEDFSDLPEVRSSILNYGMPDLSRLTLEDVAVNAVGGSIREAIVNFEPRVVPGSIDARRDTAVDSATLQLRFLVYAELRAEPLNIPVEFIAEVDNVPGKFRIERL
ncbi:type VI secretion system baseplate subunit TssE [Acuticoccus sp. MNP-M23]|uniref:type VI secretion system baseplate subunit TssE n=1 Tax=Acuticoccus sp. MNP-M23 TaxID=3072793 RepID=UPI002814DCB5|nr:type VI secretion system baseplate subunit TssE [Acuticoccus sp. MNP-M23]WMS44086.1 type VI secretion system baseplate subunit TssE [Acuticoccus sp. MNP-M23]